MNTLTLRYRYAVFCYYGNVKERIGTIMANNASQANTKAQQLYNRHAWAERLA
jgi:hypothetical protein